MFNLRIKPNNDSGVVSFKFDSFVDVHGEITFRLGQDASGSNAGVGV